MFEYEWKDGHVVCRLPTDVQERLKTAKPGDAFVMPDGTKLRIKDKDDTDDFWAWCREVLEESSEPHIREPYDLIPDSPGVTVTQLDLDYEDPIPPEMNPMPKPEKMIEELHMEGVTKTLESLEANGEMTVEVGIDSFRMILQDLFHQRWQNRQLQARGGELLEGDRASRRYAKTLKAICEGDELVRGVIQSAHPELFQEVVDA